MYAGLKLCLWEQNVSIISSTYCWPYAQYIRSGWALIWIIAFTILGTLIVSGAVLTKWIIEISGLYSVIRDWVKGFNKDNGTKLTIPGFV